MKIKNVLLVIAVLVAVCISYKLGTARIDFTGRYFDQVVWPMFKVASMWLGIFIFAMICTLSGPNPGKLN